MIANTSFTNPPYHQNIPPYISIKITVRIKLITTHRSLDEKYCPESSLVKVNIHNPAIITMSIKRCQLIVIISIILNFYILPDFKEYLVFEKSNLQSNCFSNIIRVLTEYSIIVQLFIR